ncbi:MAG: phenylacetate-CoA oxygenase subunit PaaJ [Cellvibrionaceae bacterium]|nr:phenylacetate-CoA oxygenase subunit PaaJ [Cellvibrionaceae bacterium]MCV6626872.1 phenylacetate-CoA oxygenase subunit PaaJ [Cellvibrionaceae bacterium]
MEYNPVGEFIGNNLIGSDKVQALSLEDAKAIPLAEIHAALDGVVDPEIPVLSVKELGVLRDLAWEGDEMVVTITPTYSGCPAMSNFEDDIKLCVEQLGIPNVRIATRLSPAWSSDWLTPEAKAKLLDYGIAPPLEATTSKKVLLGESPEVICPNCRSKNTSEVSRHGSTACKALYQCDDCQEPFDYFKCI